MVAMVIIFEHLLILKSAKNRKCEATEKAHTHQLSSRFCAIPAHCRLFHCLIVPHRAEQFQCSPI